MIWHSMMWSDVSWCYVISYDQMIYEKVKIILIIRHDIDMPYDWREYMIDSIWIIEII